MFIKEDCKMTVKSQILEMLNLVPDNELPTVLEVIKHFVPVDSDDVATLEDINNHNVAMNEYATGETISHDAIDWN